jgi:uncharacterized HAD superfamily protein
MFLLRDYKGDFMNIGVDFDGVVFDTESVFRVLSQIENFKIGGKVLDLELLRFQDRYNWTTEQLERFADKYVLEVHKTAQVMPYAREVLNALRKKHKVYAITSRGLILDKEIAVTNERLKKDGLEFEKVVYCSDKLQACKDLKIDLMIDDLWNTVFKLCENGVKCLYYRDNISNKFSHPNATVVRDWGEVAVELVKMGLIDIKDLQI